MEGVFLDLTFILIFASLFAILLKFVKQPPILAYIFVGLLIGPLGLGGEELLKNLDSLESLSKIGITLLLFMLGLELKLGELKSVGKVAIYTGIGQILFTSSIGLVLALLLGFEFKEALYIAIALTFSSTIVVVKLLSDKKEINSLHGKISIGFLLIQDFVAILFLVLLNGLASGGENDSLQIQILSVIFTFAKALLIMTIVVFLSQNLLPRLVKMISGSSEILFITSLAWAFGISALVSSEYIGLSIEIGGFLAGLSLANSVESYQIVSKIRPLRDFFIVIFFVTLGVHLNFTSIDAAILPSTIFTVFVLIGNPIIVLVILGMLGFKSRTGLFCGLNVAQVSEFSLIVMFIGKDLGHVTNNSVTVITIVAIVTFVVSSYLIINADLIYRLLKNPLKIFERKKTNEGLISTKSKFENHIILIGAHRMGLNIIRNLEDLKENLLILDYDPSVVHKLKAQGFHIVFGDIIDEDIRELVSIENARIVVSTIPSLEDNLILINAIRSLDKEVKIIVNAKDLNDADDLYKAGANMVIQPHTMAGNMLSSLLRHEELDFE